MEERKDKEFSGNIFLIGFMGCGKSTVSDCLCREFGMERVEMDEQIEKEEGMTIPEIFAEKGEAYFRNLETSLLKRLQSREHVVVSCGGGTAMRERNVQEMKKHGKIVLLSATAETVFERVRYSKNRPLLEGNMNVEYIRSLMEQRNSRYEAAADIIVRTDARPALEISGEILDRIRKM